MCKNDFTWGCEIREVQTFADRTHFLHRSWKVYKSSPVVCANQYEIIALLVRIKTEVWPAESVHIHAKIVHVQELSNLNKVELQQRWLHQWLVQLKISHLLSEENSLLTSQKAYLAFWTNRQWRNPVKCQKLGGGLLMIIQDFGETLLNFNL